MKIRMSSRLIKEISHLLVAIEELIPVEFSRKNIRRTVVFQGNGIPFTVVICITSNLKKQTPRCSL